MLAVPCRKCWPCQLQRRREWIARAINEVQEAEKTWLLTGTFRTKPDTADVVVGEFQRYMKRLRKRLGGEVVRYVMVVETGDLRGRLHCHALLHGSNALSWRAAGNPWTAGFIKLQLVRAKWVEGRLDEDSARQVHYVAGYITGDISFPVRASLKYGQPQRKGAPIPAQASSPTEDRNEVNLCDDLSEGRGKGYALPSGTVPSGEARRDKRLAR